MPFLLPRRLTAALLALTVVATACGDDADVTTGADTDPPAATLADRTFVSTDAMLGGGTLPLVDGTQIRLDFRTDSFNATAGCNQVSGGYALEGDTLIAGDTWTVGEMLITEMGCD